MMQMLTDVCINAQLKTVTQLRNWKHYGHTHTHRRTRTHTHVWQNYFSDGLPTLFFSPPFYFELLIMRASTSPLFLNHIPPPWWFSAWQRHDAASPLNFVKDKIIVITWMHSSNQIRKITFLNPKMREQLFFFFFFFVTHTYTSKLKGLALACLRGICLYFPSGQFALSENRWRCQADGSYWFLPLSMQMEDWKVNPEVYCQGFCPSGIIANEAMHSMFNHRVDCNIKHVYKTRCMWAR